MYISYHQHQEDHINTYLACSSMKHNNQCSYLVSELSIPFLNYDGFHDLNYFMLYDMPYLIYLICYLS